MKEKNKKPQSNKPATQKSHTYNGIPEHVAQKLLREQETRIVHENYSGPIPHPVILKGYEDILPGATDRIISMAERQSQHRHDLENAHLAMERRNSGLGLWFGFIIGMTAIICGGVGIALGQPVGGGILGTAGLGSLVGVFVYGSRERRKEQEAMQAQRHGSEG